MAASTKWAFWFFFTLAITVCVSLTGAASDEADGEPMVAGGRGGAFGIWAGPEDFALEPMASNDWEARYYGETIVGQDQIGNRLCRNDDDCSILCDKYYGAGYCSNNRCICPDPMQ